MYDRVDELSVEVCAFCESRMYEKNKLAVKALLFGFAGVLTAMAFFCLILIIVK